MKGLFERAHSSRARSGAAGSASVGDVPDENLCRATRRLSRRYLDSQEMGNDGPEVDLCRTGFDPWAGPLENTVCARTTRSFTCSRGLLVLI